MHVGQDQPRRLMIVILSLLLLTLFISPVAATAAPPDTYIIVFHPNVNAQAAASDMAQAHGLGVKFVYSHALRGMAARVPEGRLNALQNDPRVAYVEADQAVSIADTQSPATWGLDRIDQRNLPLNNSYTYNATGSGVTVYIIDTGIRITHNEFGGRASHGFTSISDGNGANDCNGHGTHVAGTVGGTTYGVAKNVTLVAVRVLDCGGSGTWAGVIAGVDWVTANAAHPAVANMSLGGGASSIVDDAVANSINSGVTYAIAAGNSSANACNYSPARTPAAITVGSTTSSDARSSFSNYGSCLDLFAPGSSITSAWNTGDSSTNTISGTSMASPHTAGVAALFLEGNPSASPSTVRNALVDGATPNVVSNAGSGSPNLLLHSLLGGGSPPTGINLSANGYKVKGIQHADLSWSGATSANVDVYRNGVKIATTANDGAYTDNIGGKGKGSYSYQVCEAGTSTCSNAVNVNY